MIRNVALILPLLVAGAVLAGCRGQAEGIPASKPVVVEATPVSVVKVALADLTSTLALSGSLMPRTRVAILPKVGGTLARVTVDIGDRVRAGQTVAVLDSREIEAQVDAARAAVGVAQASLEAADAALENATLELGRAKNLFASGALPRQRLDAAETANRSASAQRNLAKANLAQAEASLRRAREVQRDTTLSSLTDGVVVERNHDAGSLVGPGDKAIVVIADARELKLEAGVSELEAGRLQVGMPATIEVQARPGTAYRGRVAALAPEVEARNRHFRVEIRVQNPDDELLSGMYATARIQTGRAEQALVLPREALTTLEGRRVAIKVSGDQALPVTVTEGLSDDTHVQIRAGLSAGDGVLADARRPLAPGTKVKPVSRSR
jgi:RND family efflux transporter MFP subunit